jgi:hypothetical protein
MLIATPTLPPNTRIWAMMPCEMAELNLVSFRGKRLGKRIYHGAPTVMLKVHLQDRQERRAGYLEAHAQAKQSLDPPLLRRGLQRLWEIGKEPG